MAKPEWGTKRVCQSCGAKFYDLLRSPILCPACGATYDPEALLRSRRSKPAPKPKAGKVAEIEADDAVEAEEEEVEEIDEEADGVMEDTDDLGDDDDLGKVGVDKEDKEV